MLPLSRRIAVSANLFFFPCTRLEIKFILSYLIGPMYEETTGHGWIPLTDDL